MNSYTKSSKSTLIYYKRQNITATGVLNSSPIVKTDEAIKRQIHSGVQFGSEVLHKVQGGGGRVSPKPDSAASAMSNSGGNVINIPIRLDNGEFVKPNRPSGVQPYTPPPPRPPPPTIPSAEPYKPSPPQPQRPSYVPKPPSRYQRAKKTPVEKFGGQDFHELRRKHQSTRQLFVDPAFPASNRLLAEDDDQYVLSYFNKYATNSIQWLRPKEICERNGLAPPQIFVGKSDRFDIKQGEIGNCWFLAALANLAESPKCFRRVVPMVDATSEQSFEEGRGYAGIFRFRFWRFGSWVEVVVDDLLPTRNGQLIYLRSVEKNEFWGALLEKAYAKLNGSYRALIGGLTIEAAVDFTGGVPELISLTDLQMREDRLFYIMSKADDRGAFMGCSLSQSNRVREAERMGLQSRHAYTITKVVEIRSRYGAIQLIRLRNPHGNSKEWKGDWSDNDRFWRQIPQYRRDELGLTFEDDGEFYMSFRDFLKYYGELEICHLAPESVDMEDVDKKFEVFMWHGEWRRGISAGGCGNRSDGGNASFATNPQFFIDLRDPDPHDEEDRCPVIISLNQKPKQRKTEQAIGFKVFKCRNSNQDLLDEEFFNYNASVDRYDTFINLREISKRIRLESGRYCIIPCTFERGNEGEFLLRLFIEKHWGQADGADAQSVRSADLVDGVSRVNIERQYGSPEKGGEKEEVDTLPFQKQRKRSKLRQLVKGQLRKHLDGDDQGGKGKLKKMFGIVKEAEAEFELLKKIMASDKKE